MAVDYPLYTIGDVCYVTDGAHAKVERRDDGITYLTSKNIGHGRLLLDQADCISTKDFERLFTNTSRAQRRPAPGDVLIGIIGTFGNAYLYKESDNFGISSAVALLRPDTSKIHPTFLYYVVTSDVFKNAHTAYKAGSVQGYTNIPTIKRLPAPVPSLNEQRAIAHILGTLDEKIDLNRRMNETLEAMARALFKAWFVDFAPVRAKAEGRDPGLPKPVADLFPDSFEDSELGAIPNGWVVGTLADVAALNPESWSKVTRPDTINYVDLSNAKWGRIESVTTHTRQDAPSRAQRVLRSGDTIVGTVRPGNGSYAFVTEERLTGSTGFAVLRPQRQEYREYVYIAATTAENIEELAHLADGAAYPAVRPEVVAATLSVRPPDSVLTSFAKAAAPLLAKIAASERESRTLATLRDTLLPKLISGELRISVAEELMDEAI